MTSCCVSLSRTSCHFHMVPLCKQYFIRQMDATLSLPNKKKHMMCGAPCCSLRQVLQLAGSVAHLHKWRMTCSCTKKPALCPCDSAEPSDSGWQAPCGFLKWDPAFCSLFRPIYSSSSPQIQSQPVSFSFEDKLSFWPVPLHSIHWLIVQMWL